MSPEPLGLLKRGHFEGVAHAAEAEAAAPFFRAVFHHGSERGLVCAIHHGAMCAGTRATPVRTLHSL